MFQYTRKLDISTITTYAGLCLCNCRLLYMYVYYFLYDKLKLS
jgi:hypothetical protein